ncbi:S-adenosyl-L-methionine-dependent methyltransferase [Dimargaris cristalligena]|uniref:S-adenosyl-L-methionine-dependent methyltransferase n=1 Tax=Dimargaris cristalligena TaxID=215637 RepID=A0A4P9ZPV2_9FUNG|nr:S-adenosyl-L-methionine-dependent methyltransferase [Dimargaris cristalligena]|eukprot:RKP34370.1 S-adenosyl-L-methionine-dependent methyltransferase [Dimargaris cristalligena]
MKLKALESYLQEVEVFDQPKVQFEQYPTSAHLAARIIYTAENTYGDIRGQAVADLGCGCGMLSIAAGMLEAGYLCGLDIDPDALAIAQTNLDEFEIAMDFVLAFDTVLMNPPFGTKPGNRGIDMVFLQTAIHLARGAVYSLHKSSTRDFIMKKAESWGAKGQVLAQLQFDVPQMYKFHKKQSVDIEVDLWRFEIL